MLFQNAWNEALRLRTLLATFGVEAGEIAFPAPAAPLEAESFCFVSESLCEDAALTPSRIQALRADLVPFRQSLQGRSVRMEPDSVDLYDGDSGVFLVAWREAFPPAQQAV